jgi:hypothetical protein
MTAQLRPAWILAAIFLAAAGPLGAAEWHVTPAGTAGGAGSLASPWDLATGTTSAAVKPGDTVWVHAGSYHTGIGLTLKGTAGSQITVRNWPGDKVSVDLTGSNGFVLAGSGGYTTIRGMEIWCASMDHSSGASPMGVMAYGPGYKVINCVIHDTAEGISAYKEAPDNEYYGNVVYQNGQWQGPPPDTRQHGHGFYLQNLTGLKTVELNFCGDNAMEGMQIYGSGKAPVMGFRINKNTSYDTASWAGLGFSANNYILADGYVRKDIQFHDNVGYFKGPGMGGNPNALGAWTDGDDCDIQNCAFVGGYGTIGVANWRGPVTFTGNKSVHYPGEDLTLLEYDPVTAGLAGGWSWDHNEYYGTAYVGGMFAIGNSTGGRSYMNFATWKTRTGWDANSTWSGSLPTGTWRYVWPNKYDPGRVHITLLNWDKAATVDVDISPYLTFGAGYELRDAQYYYNSTPVLTGTYSGGSISIPMTGLTKAPGVAAAPGAAGHTAPVLGTFVLLLTNGSAVTPWPPAGGSSGIVYGDANGDGAFGMADINQMVDWLLSRTTPPAAGAAAFIRSDVNGDGLLTMADLNLYVDKLLGRITKFHVEP